MKIISNILLIILFFGIVFCFSCKKPEQYPVIPYIEYTDFTKISNNRGVDEKGILKFSFTDGDGDIGLAPSDTLSPFNPGSQFYYNLFITYYEKQHGIYVAVNLPMTNNSRIPVITPTGQNKSIKGFVEIELFINNPSTTFDTIAYDVTIADRAFNLSNTIRTPDIIVKKQ